MRKKLCEIEVRKRAIDGYSFATCAIQQWHHRCNDQLKITKKKNANFETKNRKISSGRQLISACEIDRTTINRNSIKTDSRKMIRKMHFCDCVFHTIRKELKELKIFENNERNSEVKFSFYRNSLFESLPKWKSLFSFFFLYAKEKWYQMK